MATGAMLWGGAAYNNGILPFKNYMFGEAYTRDGEPARIQSPIGARDHRPSSARAACSPSSIRCRPGTSSRRATCSACSSAAAATSAPSSPRSACPIPTGSIQRLEEPGRPDIRQSNRGPGTGLRVAIPILNIHKTRLNDPFMWFMGTNDQPGDYRHSGCAGCHVVYANDREPRHSLTYAQHGRDGQTATVDPTMRSLTQRLPTQDGHGEAHGAEAAAHGEDRRPWRGRRPWSRRRRRRRPRRRPTPIMAMRERGHPIRHVFTRAIPTAQCMTCHMHQPNIFLNSYLGYTMWDYESDADLMWPGPENRLPARNAEEEARFRHQRYPTQDEVLHVLDRNPEAAAPRGLWADVEFLREVYDRVNPLARHTQFADYHGHGWNFRAIFRRDREGNLLDADGQRHPARRSRHLPARRRRACSCRPAPIRAAPST